MKTKDARKRIRIIKKRLSVPGRLPVGQGTKQALLAEMGSLLANIYHNDIQGSRYHPDIKEAIEKEMDRAATELRKRSGKGGYSRGKYVRMGSITTHSKGNWYPDMETPTLREYVNRLKTIAEGLEKDMAENMGLASQIHLRRSPRSRGQDEGKEARVRSFKRWRRDPSQYDFPFVDTPGISTGGK